MPPTTSGNSAEALDELELLALGSIAHRERVRIVKEAARLLAAAGFVELPDMRCDARVGCRTIGAYYDMVLQFHDGHMEAIRQLLPPDDPTLQSQLWFPGRTEVAEADVEWSKSSDDPLEVVQELLLLPTQ